MVIGDELKILDEFVELFRVGDSVFAFGSWNETLFVIAAG